MRILPGSYDFPDDAAAFRLAGSRVKKHRLGVCHRREEWNAFSKDGVRRFGVYPVIGRDTRRFILEYVPQRILVCTGAESGLEIRLLQRERAGGYALG